jgi:hypothetical protein
MNTKTRVLSLVFCFLFLVYLLDSSCLAVSSKVTRHASSADLLKGKTEDVVISSDGTIQLGRSAETLVEAEKDVWSINSIVVSAGTVFLGTSPNGGVYKYSLGKLCPISLPCQRSASAECGVSNGQSEKSENNEQSANEPNDTKKTAGKAVEAEQHLSNEHIFAMTADVAGRLLVGISGDKCSLCRLEAGEMKTIFEPNDAKYIFAITIGPGGDIYLGTGPEGKVYQLDSFGKRAQLIYDSSDKNILSLAAKGGFVYAGSDSRGLIYKINPHTKTAAVLYDSDQPEITALLFAADDLYGAATSAQIVSAETSFASQESAAGRPETKLKKQEGADKSEGGLKLNIANTKKTASCKSGTKRPSPPKPAKPSQASYIYKVTGDGYVTNVFSETAVFFCLAAQQQNLLLGTGNTGRLFSIDPTTEQEQILYADQQASQITAVAVAGEDIYLGTANPAKLIKLAGTFAAEGTFTSDLIDAGQPAGWGKLQIEADIPQGCNVLMACRSGNVKDVNDPTFSDWSEPIEVTEPVQLRCPVGRFCQYKLILQSTTGTESSLVKEIAVACTVPNLAPRVESVSVSRIETADKAGRFKISYKADDDNDDKLIYTIDFRKLGRTNWIQLEDQLEADHFEWNGRTVEDGRYEIRVTASDERGNTAATKLTASRISDAVVVDNTSPEISDPYVENLSAKTAKITFTAIDKLSAIGRVHYTINSDDQWIGAMPNDSVYDTTNEDFSIEIEDLEAGENIIAVRVSDDVGNTTYKTFQVNVASR